MINKNFYRKTNDKKILHKVGKQWKVISVALLMAIGGGAAVATHANAQSTNAASNNNVKTEANVAHADFAHHLQGPVQVNTQSVAPKSASAKPASVSYLQTNGGSAASYYAEGAKATAAAKSNANLVNSYVKSLNAKFPAVHSATTSTFASANNAYRSDNAAAHHYSGMANNSANKSMVSALAAKAGYTANDYANLVKYQAGNYSNGAKSASANVNAISLASNLANLLSTGNWSSAAAQAKVDATSASVNANIDGTQTNVNKSASNNVKTAIDKNTKALTSATNDSIAAAGGTQLALAYNSTSNTSNISSVVSNAADAAITSATVSSAVSFYANSLNSKSAESDASGVSSYASGISNGNKDNALSSVNGHTISGPAVSAMNSLVANAYELNAYASLTAKDNSLIASADAAKGNLAAQSASYTSASNNASYVTSSANALSTATSYVSIVMNKLSTTNFSSMASSLAAPGYASTLFTFVSDMANTNSLAETDFVSLASNYGIDINTLSSNASELESVAVATSGALGASPASYTQSNLSSVNSSLAKSAVSALSTANSTSASYAKSTDEDVTLASYYASSYSVNASSDASLASSAASSANAFYAANADAKYAAASSAVALNAGIARNKNAVAHKLAMNIWLFNAYKFITVTKDGLLHQSIDYGSANDKKLAKVTKGSQYKVNGIAIANNGAIRYNITMADGTTGYFTSAAGYVEPTYALALRGNNESAKALKTVRMYKDMYRTQYAGQNFSKGDTLSNVAAVSVDGDFGGYTVFEDLKSGYFFTSNVKCVSATANKPANNNNKPANSAANHHVQTSPVQFWN